MSTTDSGQTRTSEDNRRAHRSRSAIDAYVWNVASRLQARYLNRESGGMAAIAELRRAVNSEPGDDPAVWAYTLEGLPARLRGRGDAPSPAERAVHTAMALFAVHQQSQRIGMLRAGVSLGDAARQLSLAEGASEDAVRRRFVMLSTASSWGEVVHHARGIVSQFRGAGIGLDYGRLAADLELLQHPSRAPGVRLRWGRAYHWHTQADADAPASDRSLQAQG